MKNKKLTFKNESELEQYCKEWQKEKEKHSGWTNYATWRVNIEMVDSGHYTESGITYELVVDLAEAIKENCELYLQDKAGGYGGEGLNHNYAMAFLDDVNWYEIAENMAEDKNIIQKLKDKGHIQQ